MTQNMIIAKDGRNWDCIWIAAFSQVGSGCFCVYKQCEWTWFSLDRCTKEEESESSRAEGEGSVVQQFRTLASELVLTSLSPKL